MALQGIVGGIEIQNNLLGGRIKAIQQDIQKKPFYFFIPPYNLVGQVTIFFCYLSRFQTVQCALEA